MNNKSLLTALAAMLMAGGLQAKINTQGRMVHFEQGKLAGVNNDDNLAKNLANEECSAFSCAFSFVGERNKDGDFPVYTFKKGSTRRNPEGIVGSMVCSMSEDNPKNSDKTAGTEMNLVGPNGERCTAVLYKGKQLIEGLEESAPAEEAFSYDT